MARLFSIALCCLAAAAVLARGAGPGAAELEYGFFCALETAATQEAPGTVSGTVNIVEGSPDFIGPGPEVPARIGIGFGVKVRARAGLAGPVTVEIEHPPMGPNAVTRQYWHTTLSGTDKQYLGYTFDQAYEVLPGRWTMSASANGRQIYAVSFQVVPAAQMPWIDCGWQVPIS